MRSSDWSSDVCSSDLESQSGYDVQSSDPQLLDVAGQWLAEQRVPCQQLGIYSGALDAVERALRLRCRPGNKARKSVGKGKSVSVRVDLGGRRIHNKKQQQQITEHTTSQQKHIS